MTGSEYAEIFSFQHKVLPLLFLTDKIDIKLFLNNLLAYAERFTPSFKVDDYLVLKNPVDKKEYISSFLQEDDNFVVLHFPFFPYPNWEGLAIYSFFVYNKNYEKRRYFLLEMFQQENLGRTYPWYQLVEYRIADEYEGNYTLERIVYTKDGIYPFLLKQGDTL